ncbi:hypothetical protein SGRIM128S_05365 [Streptomyces griseomycini]
MDHREAAPTSMGASPPPAVAAQELQELLARRHQVGGPRAHPLRVAHDGHGALGQHVEQQLHVVDQDRREGLHALHGDPLGDLAEQFAELGVGLGEGTRACPYVLGEQQLTARRRPQAVLGDLQGPLVGDLEVADLLDVVAPELDPQRVFLGGREHVEDAAAHRELAALLDQLHARVRGGGERLDDLVQVGALPGPQGDGLQIAQPFDLRLEYGAHGRHDDGDRAGLGVVGAGVGQAAQHGQAAADGVAAGAEPLVRAASPTTGTPRPPPAGSGSAAPRPGPPPRVPSPSPPGRGGPRPGPGRRPRRGRPREGRPGRRACGCRRRPPRSLPRGRCP